jgi:hypothetical protein
MITPSFNVGALGIGNEILIFGGLRDSALSGVYSLNTDTL